MEKFGLLCMIISAIVGIVIAESAIIWGVINLVLFAFKTNTYCTFLQAIAIDLVLVLIRQIRLGDKE